MDDGQANLNKPVVYFGACDLEMEPFQVIDEFRKAFVYNILFLGDLAIPDIFLYISRHLATSIIEPSGTTDGPFARLLRECLRNGDLITYFREETGGSFIRNLPAVEAGGNKGLHPNSRRVAEFLERAAEGRRIHYKLWPSTPLSVGYKRLLHRTLLTWEPNSLFGHLPAFFEGTAEIREVMFGEVPDDALGGIRRGEIYVQAQKYVQALGEPVSDITQLWRGIHNARLADQVHRLLKWSNYCYYYNQGCVFDVNPGLSHLDELDRDYTRYLTQLNQGSALADKVQEEFLIPSAESLMSIDPVRLLGVRDSHVGSSYFKSLQNWQAKPDEDNTHNLLDTLRSYVRSLQMLYVEHGLSTLTDRHWRLRAIVPEGADNAWAGLGWEAAKGAAIEAVGSFVPGAGFIASVCGKAATAVLSWDALRDRVGPRLGINNRVRLEVEDSVRTVRQVSAIHAVTEASFEPGQ